MDNYIVSARKYRPASFDTVVGQTSITTTLKNAIKNKQLAHAYLFCGPRGVGKTTCARIFAKTINCFNISDDFEACNNCESCNAFNDNRSYNIHELDAASNNHVEDIRNLIDQVRIPPQIGKYSIYIIDEVHMLSSQAFNAFLKTLEEPPEHAIFILATTEKHKIIPTILSRCQIFDFNRIKVNDITSHLAKVAEKEGVETDRNALNVIALKADGGMRDALSIFDQVVSFSGKTISYQSVIDNLNILDYEYYFKLSDSFLSGDYSTALLCLDKILENGFDGHNLISSLGQHFRNLLLSKDQGTLELLEMGDSINKKYREYSSKCSVPFLYKALNIVSQCDIYYKQSKNQRLHVELALMQLCNTQNQMSREGGEHSREDSGKQTASREDKPGEQSRPEAVKTEETEKTEKTEKTQKAEIANKELQEEKKADGLRKHEQASPAGNKPIQGISITQSLKNVQTENNTDQAKDSQEDELGTDEFDQEQLDKNWEAFAQSIHADQPRLHSIVSAAKPLVSDSGNIRVEVHNPLHEKAIKSAHYELLAYLKRALNNHSIEMHIMRVKSDEGPKLYTQEEKFTYLSEKNQELKKLKNTFNLDFE